MSKLGLGTHLRQGMQQRQEMILAPRMLQSIEILALPRVDLEAWLAEQSEKNEALLLEASGGVDEAPTRSQAAASRASDDHRALLEALPERECSLAESIEAQVRARDIDEPLADWVLFLVGCLDAGGILAATDAELREWAIDAELVLAGTRAGDLLLARAIAELQQLEPAGIGARSSVEALLLQLDPMDADYALLCTLLEDFLVELSRNRRPAVAEKLGLELQELDRLLAVLGALDTRPAAQLVGELAPVMHPDIVVLPGESGGFVVELARGALPSVAIDPVAEALLASDDVDRTTKTYLRDKVEKARWVTEAVEMRGATLLRVAESTLRRQAAFLEDGPTALVPLLMTEVASELELAVSTISRTVAGKSVQTPFGIIPLRTFFQSNVGENAVGGQAGTATEAARERVRQLVEQEDPRAPLSDESLVQALAALGMTVARRTVAKYRGELGIQSSYRRKKHG